MLLNYKTFMKHAEKVTKNASEQRPILKGVKHLENGTCVVTDSHRLYVVKNIHDRTDGAVITPSGKVLEGFYPDVTKLIPDPDYAQYTLKINVMELLKTVNTIASVGTLAEKEIAEKEAIRINKQIQPNPPALQFEKEFITYTSTVVKIRCQVSVEFEEQQKANAIYVLDALKMFKEAGYQLITYLYYGKMRPFAFTNDDYSLITLIMPIRTY